MTEQALADREKIAADIIKFTQDNGLQLHPGQKPLKWADLVIKKGGCPCVPTRKHCPCEFVRDDVKELGRCRCGLFCNAAYLREYNALNAGRNSKKRWNQKPKVSS
ncbi:unnamed protein product [marine sediment metagenome]|uniref:Uncharacterized protein n=1 Tax=marine sediment metagenome TaxID=412755 RepID=X1SV27_9ZZZZ